MIICGCSLLSHREKVFAGIVSETKKLENNLQRPFLSAVNS